MKPVRTSLLLSLLIVSALMAALSAARFVSAKERARTSGDDLSICRQRLSAMRGLSTMPPSVAATAPGSAIGAGSTTGAGNTTETGIATLNPVLRQSAIVADAASKLTSIQPGQAARIAGTDYQETPVFLRLDPLSLRQLVTFLHTTSSRDPHVRCRSIELSAAQSPDAWSADITLGYLAYSPLNNTAPGAPRNRPAAGNRRNEN